MAGVDAQREFITYGPSHLAVLGVCAVGAVALVVLGRAQRDGAARWFGRLFGLLVLAVQLSIQVYSVTQWGLDHSLPFQLSDLAAFATAYALWSRRRWAFCLTYYWGLTLSTQALFTPVLRGPDFPDKGFVAFFSIHVLVVWAAVYLTWGQRMRPDWSGYRFTVVVTLCWAAAMLVFNRIAGTDYGFLNAKPVQGSLLDLLGPWPWYLIPESLLVLAVWALMTWPWQARTGRRRRTTIS